jgi:hypothetical protein
MGSMSQTKIVDKTMSPYGLPGQTSKNALRGFTNNLIMPFCPSKPHVSLIQMATNLSKLIPPPRLGTINLSSFPFLVGLKE